MTATALGELLNLVEVGTGEFRSDFRHEGSRSLFGGLALYGGQLVAQAVAAAAQTASASLHPHSLHSYFLRPAAAQVATNFTVKTIRDGRSFAWRTVTVAQAGHKVLAMTASFHADSDGTNVQDVPAPPSAPPQELPVLQVPHLFGIEARLPHQPTDGPWPTRYWARCTDALPGTASSHSCVLAYISDTLTPLMPMSDPPSHHGPTLSHTLWIHRPVNIHDWVLVDLNRVSVSRGIGCYWGSMFDANGSLVASLAQEAIFKRAD